jgi:multiple sugar transport system ATP-binding protein
MAAISIERVTKIYDGKVTAVDDVSLAVGDGEFMVLVGPSGCGKSTLLRVIAGLEQLTRGRVLIGDDDVTALDPADRDLAMVFQSYALYPHKSVRENLAFGLRRRRVAGAEIDRRVAAMATMLGLEELLGRKPAALSGGQRQRVAMGRALVREPRAFLMDEPLSNLDAKLRTTMRGELARLHERLPTSTVYVTHDQVEAMTLGQRVAVMKDGKVQQCDAPQRLFDQPANLFVGAFIGSPAMNLVEATVANGRVRFGEQEIRIEGAGEGIEGEVVLGLRPTSLAIPEPHLDPGWPRMTARVDVVEALGAERNLLFAVDAPAVATEDVRAAIGGAGATDEGRLLADDRRARFTARIQGPVPITPGETIELAIDPSQLHLFERKSGKALEWRGSAGRAAEAMFGAAAETDPQ